MEKKTLAEKILLVEECYSILAGPCVVSLQVTRSMFGQPTWNFVARPLNDTADGEAPIPEYQLLVAAREWSREEPTRKVTDPTALVDRVLIGVYKALQAGAATLLREPGCSGDARGSIEQIMRELEKEVVG